jgi:glycosyltransferase involved in cell wall biosynthesis
MPSKKIIEVIYSFEMGGSERLACAIAESLLEKNYEIKVVALRTISGPIKAQLEQGKIEAIGMDLEGKNYLYSFWKIFKLFKKEKPNVIHAHHVTQLVKIYWPARLAGIKNIILTEHASYSLYIKPKLRLLAKIFAKRANKVTTVFKGLEELFINDFHVDPGKIITIPNGVDVDKYKSVSKEKIVTGNTLQIACIGRLVEAKDHANLIKAIRHVIDSGTTNIHVNIIGDGPLQGQIVELIKITKVGDYISMLGNRLDIDALLRSHDVLVLPSKREGFPMVILEAMSSGLPCVATRVGGVPDVINSSNGWLVNKEDPADLARAIMDAYHNKSKLFTMGMHARETVLEKYDIKKVLKLYEAIF